LQRDYEILYIVRPDIEESDLPNVTRTVEGLIENLDGTVQQTNVWGKRRLAYEVAHLREGHYVLTDFAIEPGRVPEMEATLKISDNVFRHLIVRKPPAKGVASGARQEAAAVGEEPATDADEEPVTAAAVTAESPAEEAGEAVQAEE
jgi:small subunit ribosomal protein S6